jgi:hypothetical protein
LPALPEIAEGDPETTQHRVSRSGARD